MPNFSNKNSTEPHPQRPRAPMTIIFGNKVFPTETKNIEGHAKSIIFTSFT